MRLKSVHIGNGFKRFADLTISDLPVTARLIVLLGTNGSGKSSFLDALFYWHRHNANRTVSRSMDPDYYSRPNQSDLPSVQVEWHDPLPSDPVERARSLHFRTAYRYTSDFASTSIGGLRNIEYTNLLGALIDEDHSVAEHYNRLVGLAVAAFAQMEVEVSNRDVYASKIEPLAESMNRLFRDLTLTGLGDPTNKGTFLFTKGSSQNFRYVNLSAGEKAAFDLLLDLHIRKEYYPNSLICLDEPDLHTGLALQAALLDEMLLVIPETCQLMIASHSIGMMRRAFEIARESPEQVVFLNFNDRDFDSPVIMQPEAMTRVLWQSLLQVALDDLAALVAPKRVFVCEGKPDAPTRSKQSFDAAILNRIFGDAYPTIEFVSAGGTTQLRPVADSMTTVLKQTEVLRVIDRDSRTDESIAALKVEDPLLRILSVRDLENYLLSDEVLKLGSQKWSDDADSACAILLEKKRELLGSAPYPDDVKAIAGSLFEEAKRRWGKLAQPGQDRTEFLRDVCAPLVVSDTDTYRALAADLGLEESI